MILDYLQANKLALSKVKEQGWDIIKVKLSSHQILNLLRAQSSYDTIVVAHLEDIMSLNSIFRKYSFDKPDVE